MEFIRFPNPQHRRDILFLIAFLRHRRYFSSVRNRRVFFFFHFFSLLPKRKYDHNTRADFLAGILNSDLLRNTNRVRFEKLILLINLRYRECIDKLRVEIRAHVHNIIP